MKKSLFVFAAAAGVLISGPLSAASLTNYDEASQVVVLTEQGNETTLTLEGNQTIEDVCLSGCVLKFANGEEYNLTGSEIVAIEDNQVYVDQMDGLSNEPDEEQPTETDQDGEEAPEEEAEEESPQE